MLWFGNKPRKTHGRVVRSRPRRGSTLPPRRVQENYARHFTRAWFYVLCFLFLSVSVYIVFFSDFLKVRDISFAHPPETFTSRDALQGIRDYMNIRVFGFLSRENFLFFSQDSLQKFFQDRYRTVRSVRVEKSFPDSVRVTFDERHVAALWCVPGKCFQIDKEGYAFNQDDENPEALYGSQEISPVPIFVQEAPDGDILNTTVLSPDELEKWVSFWKLFQEEGSVGARFVRMPKDASYEFTVETREGWPVRMSTEFSLDQGLRMLKTFLTESITPEERSQIESVDLRSENKIFYTLRGSGEDEDEKENKTGTKDALEE